MTRGSSPRLTLEKRNDHGYLPFGSRLPEKLAFSGEVDQVDVPGVEGDFGALAMRLSSPRSSRESSR